MHLLEGVCAFGQRSVRIGANQLIHIAVNENRNSVLTQVIHIHLMLDRTASGGDDFIVQLADLDCRFCFNGAKACLSAFLENFRNGLSGLFDNDIIQVNELLLHTVLQHFANGCLAGRGHSDQYDIAALAQHILIDIVDDLIVDTLIQEELHGLLCLCYQHLQTVYTLDIHFLRLEAQSCHPERPRIYETC